MAIYPRLDSDSPVPIYTGISQIKYKAGWGTKIELPAPIPQILTRLFKFNIFLFMFDYILKYSITKKYATFEKLFIIN